MKHDEESKTPPPGEVWSDGKSVVIGVPTAEASSDAPTPGHEEDEA